MIEEYAKSQGLRKATAASKILEQYVTSPFPLSPHSSLYFMKQGRSSEAVKGKGMNITIRKVIDNEIRIQADKKGIKENDFRTAIIFSFIEKKKGKEKEAE